MEYGTTQVGVLVKEYTLIDQIEFNTKRLFTKCIILIFFYKVPIHV